MSPLIYSSFMYRVGLLTSTLTAVMSQIIVLLGVLILSHGQTLIIQILDSLLANLLRNTEILRIQLINCVICCSLKIIIFLSIS